MKMFRNVPRVLIIILLSGSLVGCNKFSRSSPIPGITYISSLGNPEAYRLVWSPKDSTKILVSASHPERDHPQVYILDTMTKKKTMLVDTDYGRASGEDWSPDGKRVVFSVDGGTRGFIQGGLWVMNMENNSWETLSDMEGDITWLPDGKTLALLTLDPMSNQNPRRISVYMLDIQTLETKLIYSNQKAISYSGLSSSPDGKFLVFSLNSDYYSAERDLYILETQTETVSQLTFGGRSSFPQWSPKGNLMVYVKSNKVGNKTTYSLRLLQPGKYCDVEVPYSDDASSPSWSPDGRKIAFIGKDGIYILDTDIVFGRDIYKNLCP